MPQPRKHRDNAERQKAYREREKARRLRREKVRQAATPDEAARILLDLGEENYAGPDPK